MILLVGGVMCVVLNVLGELVHGDEPALLPNTYKDVFLAGLSGKPTLGTMQSTCWARGGICVDIRQCPDLHLDVSVPGCSWGYKVCCKVHKLGSPTVGVLRRYDVPVIKDLQELGASLEIIALRNSMLISNWNPAKPSSDEVNLDDLMS